MVRIQSQNFVSSQEIVKCNVKWKYHAKMTSFENPKTFVCQQKKEITV